MSHPLSDPALSAVAARMSGLEVPLPRRARILEIGCCSGHNILPLAERWPEGYFVGIDLAESSIIKARELAAATGLENVTFHAGDLAKFSPQDGPFDFIIAHGFFSWVPDEVKAALLVFCHEHLSPSGVAMVSFNLECGWKARLPTIQKARAIQQARGGGAVEALEILSSLLEPDDPEISIIEDMLAKGEVILAFDEFGPINDPWSLDRFVSAAANVGLRWLGESDPNENIPRGLSREFVEELKNESVDALSFQNALDESVGQTFRSGLLCRADAPVSGGISSRVALDFSVRASAEPDAPEAKVVYHAVRAFAPACVSVKEVIASLPGCDVRAVARLVLDGIHYDWLQPRIEPVKFAADAPEFPRLTPFLFQCARRGLPLMDAWHEACEFPEAHYELLAAMDGHLSYDQLAQIAQKKCPELAFKPWLGHLAYRGMLL